jgi:hypothetical protein
MDDQMSYKENYRQLFFLIFVFYVHQLNSAEVLHKKQITTHKEKKYPIPSQEMFERRFRTQNKFVPYLKYIKKDIYGKKMGKEELLESIDYDSLQDDLIMAPERDSLYKRCLDLRFAIVDAIIECSDGFIPNPGNIKAKKCCSLLKTFFRCKCRRE